MRRFLAVFVFVATGVMTGVLPAHAAGEGSHDKVINWDQRDTAVYVVSTLNLLHTHAGKPITDVLSRKLHVARYDIYADSAVANLYFIQLRRDDGSVAGVFAYEIGWSKPMLVSLSVRRALARRAPDKLSQEYRTDPKQLIGSFTSTLPS